MKYCEAPLRRDSVRTGMLARDVMPADKPVMSTAEIHIEEELLDDFFLRRCDAHTRAAVAQHLAGCSECLAKWVELMELRAALVIVTR